MVVIINLIKSLVMIILKSHRKTDKITGLQNQNKLTVKTADKVADILAQFCY